MQREYFQRRSAPLKHAGGEGRRYANSRKKSGPPPIIFLIFVVVAAIVITAAVVLLGGKDGEKPADPQPVSRLSSQEPISSTPNIAISAAPEPTPESEPVSQSTSTTPDDHTKQEPKGEPENLGVLLRVGDTAYEYYNFVTDYANRYISIVADAEQKTGGAVMYDMVVPTSMSVMLPQDYLEQHGVNTSDQRKAIEEYIYPSLQNLNPDVKTVSIFDTLTEHNDEYIFFRTDHHWTQLGAYYAYEEFCKAKGVSPVPLDQFDKREYEGFLGSFYSDAPNTVMEENPDTVEAYIPRADTTLRYTTTDGEVFEHPLIADGSEYAKEWLYLIFAAGDQPYEEIENHDLSDGSSCIVVKESFGNAFVPFLVNHYQTVYVVDYRSYAGKISDLVEETGAEDVLLLNNISMTRNEGLIDDLEKAF